MLDQRVPSPDDERLLEVAIAIADGTPVDWSIATPSDTPGSRSVEDSDSSFIVRRLQCLERLVRGHEAVRSADRRDSTPARETLLTEARQQSGESTLGPLRVQWGPLIVREKVGRGSFGDVYRAWDPRLDREVALKLIPEKDSAAAGSPVVEEGRLLARVRHPNVLTVYGAERIDGRIGIWTEYVRGETLAQEVARRGPLPPEEAASIGAEVCAALAAVHAAGLLHRDVKAQNVLRDATGRIVLGDFGTGVPYDEDAGVSDPQIAGTPLYLAPEVIEGRPATVRSDLYSVGVLLYFLVTRDYPVPGRTLAGIKRAHATHQRVALRAARPDLPSGFTAIVEGLLAAGPDRPYGEADAVERALTVWLGESTIGDGGSVQRRSAWAQRLTVTITAALVVSTVVGAAVWRFRSDSGVEQRQSTEVPPVAARPPGVMPESESHAAEGKPASDTGAGESQEGAAPLLRLNGGDWILVAGIDNRTGEEVLDGTIEAAIKRELEYSEHIRVAQRDRVEDALRALGEALDSRLDRGLARKMALRDGALRAELAGSVEKVRGAYVITLDLVRPDDDRTVTSVIETVTTQQGILPAVRKQVLAIREALGEPQASVDRSRMLLASTPLPSIKALHLYTQAAATMNLRETQPLTGRAARESITRLAVQEDPMFARAAIMLAWVLRNQGRPREEVLPYAELAFNLADIATPQERYFIIGSFHHMQSFASGPLTAQRREELERAIAAYEALFALQPDHYDLVNNLRAVYSALGRDRDRASMDFRLAETRPLSVTENLAVANRLLRDGNLDGARRYAARAESALPRVLTGARARFETGNAPPTQTALARLFSAYIAWLQDDPREALRIADRVLSTAGEFDIADRRELYSRLWALYAVLGRLRQAEHTIEALRRTDGVDLNTRLQSDLAQAQFLSTSDQLGRLRELMAAWAREPLAPDTPPYFAGRVGYLIEGGLLEAAERDLEWFKQRSPGSSPSIYENFHAFLERARGHPDAAITGIQKAKTFIIDPDVNRGNQQGQSAASELAFALESVGRLSEAIDALEYSGGDRAGIVTQNALGRWLRGRAQLARLYRKNGQDEKARELEAHLLKLLAMADAGHPLVQELRARR